MTKKCNKCEAEKPLEDFYKSNRGCKHGRAGRCKDCIRQCRNRVAHREAQSRWRATEGAASTLRGIRARYKEAHWGEDDYHKGKMLSQASRNAKVKGVPFSLTREDFEIPQQCPVLGIPLHFTRDAKPFDNSPSLDRIVPDLGYVAGNVVVVSLRCNRIKNDATVGELVSIAKYYTELTKDTK